MKAIIDGIMTIVFSGAFFFGHVYTIKKAHDYFKTEAIKNIQKGLSSSEELANALTGEKLGF